MENEELLSEEQTKAVIDLGNLILQFGRTNRATFYQDGTRPESDTDHTVMFGIIACAFADTFAPELDKGAIAQFALVHDLVEAYAGDTPTMRTQSADQKKEKEDREHAALQRIKKEFDHVSPWISATIESYESLDTAEARFVKFVDKVLPKVTHILNGGALLQEYRIDEEEMTQIHTSQYTTISESYGADLAAARRLYASLSIAVRKALFG